ncbi:AEC family transporter [Leucobacter sp. W1153]|uniref:AEC family transporter n=1 Tax=Leucobacter sp. W1153 TaxID=3439064 RepID=UPI003F3941CF
MFGVLQGFALILGIIGAGYVASRFGVVKGEQRLVLNRVAFYVATPALLFTVLQSSDPAVIVSPVILVTGLTAVLAAGLYVLASRLWFRRGLAGTTLGATSSGYVNSNNLGLPVAIYILGDAAYVAPLILLQVVVFSPLILAILESTRGNQRGAAVALGRAAQNPIIIASALGLLVALFGLTVPEILLNPIAMIGDASIPMVLLSFGISLHGQRVLQTGVDRPAILVASGIKLLVMPAITWALCLAFGLSAHETFVATTIAALPTAQNVYNYAATYRRAETQVRDTVFLTTFASLPVIAVIAWLLAA